MKLVVAFLVIFHVVLLVQAKPLEDKFAFLEKLSDGTKLGCYGQINNGIVDITHYIVDARGFRKVLKKADERVDNLSITNKAGEAKSVSFRPLGEEPEHVGYFPDECFI